MTEIIIAIISSGALFSFITYLITRHDKRKDNSIEIKKELQEIKKNQQEQFQNELRLQLLILIAHYPNEEHRIMQTAQEYFVAKHGNWWAGAQFSDYCNERGIVKPDWFKEN